MLLKGIGAVGGLRGNGNANEGNKELSGAGGLPIGIPGKRQASSCQRRRSRDSGCFRLNIDAAAGTD
jgi:hypothetical protein